MSATRAGLMRAILDQPDDDEVRLVFADYLEDHGEEDYARFIRKQIALAGVPEYDPAYIRAATLDWAVLSGQGLKHYLPDLPAGLKWPPAPFRRGFPAWVELQENSEAALAHFARVAPDLFAVAPIEGLDFTARFRAAPPNLAALTGSPALARLTGLRFSLGDLPAMEIQRLQDSPHAGNLTDLAFEFAGIATGAIPTLFRPPLMQRLRRLKLRSNNLSSLVLSREILAAGGPFQLRRLDLPETSVYSGGARLLYDCRLLETVRELDLSGTEYGAGEFTALADSQVAYNLASLDLSKTMPRVDGVRAVAESSAFSALRRLRLANNRLGPVAVRSLSESVHLAGLYSLDLSQNPIKDSGLARLIEAAFWPGLVDLVLDGCEIGEAGVRLLLEAPVPRRLVRLSISVGA